MLDEIKSTYNDLALVVSEVSVLKELEGLLQDSGQLDEGEAIPAVARELIDGGECAVGFCVENGFVVTLAIRYCALHELPVIKVRFI